MLALLKTCKAISNLPIFKDEKNLYLGFCFHPVLETAVSFSSRGSTASLVWLHMVTGRVDGIFRGVDNKYMSSYRTKFDVFHVKNKTLNTCQKKITRMVDQNREKLGAIDDTAKRGD